MSFLPERHSTRRGRRAYCSTVFQAIQWMFAVGLIAAMSVPAPGQIFRRPADETTGQAALGEQSSDVAAASRASAELASTARGTPDSTLASPGMVRIPPGTIVANSDAPRWNQIVLVAQPKLASGDVDAIPSMIGDMASTFVLTIMATIEPLADRETGKKKFRLKEVGVGFSMDLDGQLTVLSVDSQQRLGANLGFVGKRMLESNEKQLGTARVVAKTSTLLMFDTPAILLRDGMHRNFTMRHFIWIDSQTGKCSALVWLITEDDNGQQVVAREPLRWVAAGTREVRKIHVDSSQFVLGLIPPESAFALEDLPPGRSIPWTEESRRLAAKTSYDLDVLRELTVALNQALQSLY